MVGSKMHLHRCCPNTVVDLVLTHLLWHPERLEMQEGYKKFASRGYTWLLLMGLSFVPVNTHTVQESAWETPAPLQSNSIPVASASISHLLLGVVKSSPRGRKGKGQIFPSFGLGAFPRKQLTLHSANTFKSLKDFPWTYIYQLIGNFPCFFLSPIKCLPFKELTKLESFLALPCFHHSLSPFPLLQPFLSTISPLSIQPF